jgi:hypothetical protein
MDALGASERRDDFGVIQRRREHVEGKKCQDSVQVVSVRLVREDSCSLKFA